MKDALSAWRQAYKLSPDNTLRIISELLKPAEAEPIKRMLTLRLPVLLKETAERGRFFSSSDVLEQGRSVFFEHPYIMAIDDAYLRKNCHHCCQPLKTCVIARVVLLTVSDAARPSTVSAVWLPSAPHRASTQAATTTTASSAPSCRVWAAPSPYSPTRAISACSCASS